MDLSWGAGKPAFGQTVETGGSMVGHRDETYAPAHAEQERDADALERYRDQRIAEIRAGIALPERGFVPLDRLKRAGRCRTRRGRGFGTLTSGGSGGSICTRPTSSMDTLPGSLFPSLRMTLRWEARASKYSAHLGLL
jgi:hypothetical protein